MASILADNFNVVAPSAAPGSKLADNFNTIVAPPSTSPTGLTATPLNAAATLTWTPPDVTVASYTVTATSGSLIRVYSVSGTVSTATLLQLTNSLTWSISLTANVTGTATTPATTTVTPLSSLTAPPATGALNPQAAVSDPPTLISVTPPANSAAVVTWTPPAYTGGSVITSYRVTASDVSGAAAQVVVTVAGNVTTANVSLTNGVTYSIAVQAVNATGTSAASNTINVTPSSGGVVVEPVPPTPPPVITITPQPVFYAFPAGDFFVPSNWLKTQGQV